MFQEEEIDSAGRSVRETACFTEVEDLGAIGIPDSSVHEIETCLAKFGSINRGLNCVFSNAESGLEEAEKVGGVRVTDEGSNCLIPGHVDHVLPDGGKSEILVHFEVVFHGIADGQSLNHENGADDHECESSNSHLYRFNLIIITIYYLLNAL